MCSLHRALFAQGLTKLRDTKQKLSSYTDVCVPELEVISNSPLLTLGLHRCRWSLMFLCHVVHCVWWLHMNGGMCGGDGPHSSYMKRMSFIKEFSALIDSSPLFLLSYHFLCHIIRRRVNVPNTLACKKQKAVMCFPGGTSALLLVMVEVRLKTEDVGAPI